MRCIHDGRKLVFVVIDGKTGGGATVRDVLMFLGEGEK
jgi:hypothetical protein